MATWGFIPSDLQYTRKVRIHSFWSNIYIGHATRHAIFCPANGGSISAHNKNITRSTPLWEDTITGAIRNIAIWATELVHQWHLANKFVPVHSARQRWALISKLRTHHSRGKRPRCPLNKRLNVSQCRYKKISKSKGGNRNSLPSLSGR